MYRRILKTHVHVMNSDQAQAWYQPIRPLREWFQDDLIGQVEEAARRSGCGKAMLFDTEENLKWQSD